MKLKLTASLLSVCFLMGTVGCSDSKEKPSVSKGRYIEEEMITIDQMSTSMSDLFLINGEVSFVDNSRMKLYSQNENKTAFSMPKMALNYLLGEEMAIRNISASPDGTLFCEYYNISNQLSSNFALISADGELNELKLDCSSYFVSCAYGNDGILYATDLSGALYEINTELNKIIKICDLGNSQRGYKLDCAGDLIIAANSDEILMFDCKSRSLIDTPQAIADFWNENIIGDLVFSFCFDICEGEENSFYIVCENGLFRYVMDGALVEQLIDGYSCHLANPRYTLRSVIRDGDAFIISYEEGNFFRYTYDAEAINEITSSLTVYSLEKNDTLSVLISEYRTQYPTVRIDYEVGMRSGMTYDDALKNLTTAILSDNAPDIILLDGLDIDNLEENNMLLDLSECEDKWNPDNNLLDNVAKWNDEDGLYSVACKFRIPAIAASAENLEKINSFTDLADRAEFLRKTYNREYPISYFDYPQTPIRLGLMYGNAQLFEENNLDKEKLETFFDDCSRLYNNDQHPEHMLSIGNQDLENINDEYKFSLRLTPCIFSEHTIALGTINTFEYDLNTAESIENTENKYNSDYRFGISDEIKAFVPNCNLAVVQSTKKQDEALDFIELALDKEIQKINLNDGFPVNTETLEWFYDKNKTLDRMWIATFSYENLDDSVEFFTEWMDDSEVSDFKIYINSLDEPIMIDSITRSIIEDAGVRCINGSITPGEAADEVIRQLELKMKE